MGRIDFAQSTLHNKFAYFVFFTGGRQPQEVFVCVLTSGFFSSGFSFLPLKVYASYTN